MVKLNLTKKEAAASLKVLDSIVMLDSALIDIKEIKFSTPEINVIRTAVRKIKRAME